MGGFFNPQSYEKGSDQKKILPKIPQCGRCGLSKKCASPRMEPSGKGRWKILFVGEAPGSEEDRDGVQFIGDSGKLLRGVLKDIGMNMNDGWITNSVICHPPKNKIEPYMISSCHPSLVSTIRKLKPKVIVSLGSSAIESLLMGIWPKGVGSISKWVGWNIPVMEYGAWICPTYHPAYLLRRSDPLLDLLFKDHLQRAINLLGEDLPTLNQDALERKVEIIQSRKEARLRIRDLSQREGLLAFDYETTGLKPDREKMKIVSVSFCLNGEETFACMMDESLEDDLIEVLRNPDLLKIASNIKFEERWSIAKLGCRVRGWHWDTMLASHCLDNRPDITSIKFQAFIHLGVADYDSHISPFLKSASSNGINKIHDLDERDLLLYNGMDSLLEYMVHVKQKELFKEGRG